MPATFHTNGSLRIEGLFPGAIYRTHEGDDGDGLLFTDTDPDTGAMRLKLSLRSSGGWASPVVIASGGILAADLATLPDGRWLVAWTQIAPDDFGNAFPNSTVNYSLGNPAGTSWSAPAVIANLPDVAAQLRLMANAAFTGLAWLRTGDGPRAERFTLETTTWNGSSWSAPTTLAADADIVGLAATPNQVAQPPFALLAATHASGTAKAWLSDGTSFGPPVTLTNIAGDRLAATATSAGDFYVALEGNSGGIQLWQYHGSSWTNLGDLAPDARPARVALTSLPDNGGERQLVAWIEGGDLPRTRYAFADMTGAVLKAPATLPQSTSGPDRDLQVLAGADGAGMVFTRTAGNPPAVWEWLLPFHETPRLAVSLTTANSATLFWTPDTGTNWVLQEGLSLTSGGWSNSPSGWTNPVTVPATAPRKFYRLFNP